MMISHHKFKTLAFSLLALWLCISTSACNTLPNPPKQVTIIVDGQTRTVETEEEEIWDLLQSQGITLENLDRITPAETTGIRDGMTITITRLSQSYETITETLPFERRVVRDASIPEGETRLLQAGKEGRREYVYRATMEDGLIVERTLVRETITEPPRDEVLLVGTHTNIQTQPVTGTLTYLNKQDAWLMRTSSGNRRRLTTLGDLDERVFALSPDGTRLIFTRAVTEEDHINALWLIRTVQADDEPTNLKLYDVLWADWSPNGERIAWTTAEPAERASGWRGLNDLYTAIVNSRDALISRREVVAPEAGGGYGWWGTRYAWAPDSKALAYTQPEEIGIVNLYNGRQETLARFAAYRTYSSWAWTPHVTWAPSGDFITTILHGPNPNQGDPEESPVFDLWTLEATGAYSAELVSEVGMWATPRYAPDGETLLFGWSRVPYQSQTSEYTLCFIDRDGSNRHCPHPPEDERGLERPEWHWDPDGQAVLFISQGDLHLYTLAQGRVFRLTDEGGITRVDWE